MAVNAIDQIPRFHFRSAALLRVVKGMLGAFVAIWSAEDGFGDLDGMGRDQLMDLGLSRTGRPLHGIDHCMIFSQGNFDYHDLPNAEAGEISLGDRQFLSRNKE